MRSLWDKEMLEVRIPFWKIKSNVFVEQALIKVIDTSKPYTFYRDLYTFEYVFQQKECSK
jgi:hypothetical protein